MSAGHYAVGASVVNADVLILVGERTLMIAEAAVDRGFKQDRIHWFADSEQAALCLGLINRAIEF